MKINLSEETLRTIKFAILLGQEKLLQERCNFSPDQAGYQIRSERFAEFEDVLDIIKSHINK